MYGMVYMSLFVLMQGAEEMKTAKLLLGVHIEHQEYISRTEKRLSKFQVSGDGRENNDRNIYILYILIYI